MSDREDFEGWVVLELMGHRRLAGFLTEQTIAGSGFLRIDIPSNPPVTQLYSPQSVYCVTPTTEAVARRAATSLDVGPVEEWRLRLPMGEEEGELPF